jgi:hypothetical protein
VGHFSKVPRMMNNKLAVVVCGLIWQDFAVAIFLVTAVNAVCTLSVRQELLVLGIAAGALSILFAWRQWRPLTVAEISHDVLMLREIGRIPPRVTRLVLSEISRIEVVGAPRAPRLRFHLVTGEPRQVSLGYGTHRLNRRIIEFLHNATGMPVTV